MIILGINYIFHDSSACIIKDGEILYAVEEERLSRQKHTQCFPIRAISDCFEQNHLTPKDVDHIAVSINPGASDGIKLAYATKLGSSSGSFLDYEFDRLRQRNLAFWTWFHKTWPKGVDHGPTVHFVDHHLAHAVGTYYVSPWDDAALMSIDGWGEWSTTWLGQAEGTRIENFTESFFPNSLGVFYSAATECCGFKPNYDEGKTMGLAPCGDKDRFFNHVDKMVATDQDGRVQLDLSWFDFPSFSGRLCGKKMLEILGPMRKSNETIKDHHADVAAAFQAVLEKNILKLARYLRKRTGKPKLVYSGGVALNSVVNGLIVAEGVFDDIFIMPGAGDSGTAIGAAAYAHSAILKQKKRIRHTTPYLGRSYSKAEVVDCLNEAKVPFDTVLQPLETVAKALADGKIVGWFSGRMEFGPRSLGSRSILADPTNPGMKTKINAEVKHREPFRPFAPSVCAEHAQRYFDISIDVPYMLKVAKVRPEMRSAIPAVIHVDGTARLQTVAKDCAQQYHALICEFAKLSGHPVVLNTSFNVMGEPIVESPLDALRCFYSTGLDLLVMGSVVIQKPAEKTAKREASIAAQ